MTKYNQYKKNKKSNKKQPKQQQETNKMPATNIDYANTYFEYPELSKIHGTPTYPLICIIKDEIKAHANSVASDLGGGANGHYDLVVNPAEYAMVLGTIPYVRPVHPGALNIPLGSTQHAATALREDHKEAIRVFREVNDVEQRIIKQLVRAIDATYLKTLRNASTNTITCDVPTILSHLFANYGLIGDDTLTEAEQKIKEIQYNLLDPLVKVFDEIEELQHLGIAAKDPYSEAQLIKFGFQIIKNTHDFETGIEKWIDLPRQQKTWAKFKSHFESAHLRLREIRGATMRSSSFNQVNLILAQVNDVKHAIAEAAEQDTTEVPELQEENINQVGSSTDIQLEMMKTIQAMQKEMKALKESK